MLFNFDVLSVVVLDVFLIVMFVLWLYMLAVALCVICGFIGGEPLHL